MASRC